MKNIKIICGIVATLVVAVSLMNTAVASPFDGGPFC